MNERLVMMEGKNQKTSFHSVEKLTGNCHNPSTLGDGNYTAQNQLSRGTSGHLIVAHSLPALRPKSHILISINLRTNPRDLQSITLMLMCTLIDGPFFKGIRNIRTDDFFLTHKHTPAEKKDPH